MNAVQWKCKLRLLALDCVCFKCHVCDITVITYISFVHCREDLTSLRSILNEFRKLDLKLLFIFQKWAAFDLNLLITRGHSFS